MEIHHVGYLVKNIEESEKEFFSFGYQVEKPKQYDELRKLYIEFLVNDGYRLELVEPVSEESVYYNLLHRYKNTAYHICYCVSDMKNVIDELEKKHYVMMQDPLEAPCLDGKKVCFMTHRNMGMIELLEEEDDIDSGLSVRYSNEDKGDHGS